MPLRIKVDTNFDHRQTTKPKAIRILLQVNLTHRHLRTLIQLQLHDIEGRLGTQYQIYPSIGGTYLHIHIQTKEREDHLEQLLIMPLIIRMVGIGDCTQECLQQAKRLVHPFLTNRIIHQPNGG